MILMSRNKEYIFEFYAVGKSLKVSAIDPETLREVSMVADPKTPREELKRLAVQKLEYVLQKGYD